MLLSPGWQSVGQKNNFLNYWFNSYLSDPKQYVCIYETDLIYLWVYINETDSDDFYINESHPNIGQGRYGVVLSVEGEDTQV